MPACRVAQVLFYCGTLQHEFIEEYKHAHGMEKPTGPGRQEPRGFQKERREPVPLPVSGTDTLSRAGSCGDPQRAIAKRSSNVIGGWWNDELFQRDLPAPAARPVNGIGTQSQREVGSFYHDKETFGESPKPTTKFNRKKVIETIVSSSFALEDLPIADRML